MLGVKVGLRTLTALTVVLVMGLLVIGYTPIHTSALPVRLADPLDRAEAAAITEVHERFAAMRLHHSIRQPTQGVFGEPPLSPHTVSTLPPAQPEMPEPTASKLDWRSGGPRSELFARERLLGAVIRGVPLGRPVWLSIANSAVTEIALNWAAHIFHLGVEHSAVIACLDAPLLQAMLSARVPAFSYIQAGFERDVRSSRIGFRQLGVLKAQLTLHILSAGRNVLLSDVDVVWLRDPIPLLLAREAADLMLSTDCLSVSAEEANATAWVGANRCAFLPGNGDGHAAFNTGILYFRSSVGALGVAAAWLALLCLPAERDIDDQLAMNHLIWDSMRNNARRAVIAGPAPGTIHCQVEREWGAVRGWKEGWHRHVNIQEEAGGSVRASVQRSTDARVPPLPSRGNRSFCESRIGVAPVGSKRPPSFTLAPLPARHFCSGHLYWLQQSMAPRDCVAVHMTFTQVCMVVAMWRMLPPAITRHDMMHATNACALTHRGRSCTEWYVWQDLSATRGAFVVATA